MEAWTSSPRRLQIVMQNQERKEEKNGSSRKETAATKFLGNSRHEVLLDIKIRLRACHRARPATYRVQRWKPPEKQSRRNPGHRRRRRGHYLPRTDIPTGSPVSEMSSCCVVLQSSARATCEAVELIPTSAKRESGICRRIYHTYSARAPKRRDSPGDCSGDYLGVPKYPHRGASPSPGRRTDATEGGTGAVGASATVGEARRRGGGDGDREGRRRAGGGVMVGSASR